MMNENTIDASRIIDKLTKTISGQALAIASLQVQIEDLQMQIEELKSQKKITEDKPNK